MFSRTSELSMALFFVTPLTSCVLFIFILLIFTWNVLTDCVVLHIFLILPLLHKHTYECWVAGIHSYIEANKVFFIMHKLYGG